MPCSITERLDDHRFEVPPRQVDLHNCSIAADESVGRDIGDPVGPGVVAVAGAVHQRWPGDIVVEQETVDIGQDGFEFLAAVLLGVEVDSHDL